MNFLHCTVTDGPRDGYKAVEIQDAEGNTEYFVMDERLLVETENEFFVPVSRIGEDPDTGLVLVQLPVETDSGAKRVWIASADVQGRIPA